MNTRSKTFEHSFYNWHISPQNKKTSNKFNYGSAMNHLRNNYSNPSGKTSFADVNRLYNYYHKIIPVKDIKQFLSKDNSYTLHARSFLKTIQPFL